MNVGLIELIWIMAGSVGTMIVTVIALVAKGSVWKTKTDDKIGTDTLRITALENKHASIWREIAEVKKQIAFHEKECASNTSEIKATMQAMKEMLERVLNTGCDPVKNKQN